MADILQEIVAHKRCDLDRLLCKRVSMAEALRQSPSGIIAEFKRKSPSKGWIHADVEPEQVIPRYVEGGAAALSILTNEEYFGGKPEYITRVRGLVGSCPILRKEFIVDPYQVYEAKMLGADAILLIAAALAPQEYAQLLDLAHQLHLEVLLEVHDPAELEYLKAGVPDMLGVNNRSLGTFHTDVQHSFEIAEAMLDAVSHLGTRRPVLVVDIIGFIFWPGSKRYVSTKPDYLPIEAERAGVFVNASPDEIVQKVKEYGLQYVQLHGDEDIAYVTNLQKLLESSVPRMPRIVRAIQVESRSKVLKAMMWDGFVDGLLFEAPTTGYGGSGVSFDWSLLSSYRGNTPFFITGGIGPQSLDALLEFEHPQWIGVDLNSRFESSPGFKDVALLRPFVEALKKMKN